MVALWDVQLGVEISQKMYSRAQMALGIEKKMSALNFSGPDLVSLYMSGNELFNISEGHLALGFNILRPGNKFLNKNCFAY